MHTTAIASTSWQLRVCETVSDNKKKKMNNIKEATIYANGMVEAIEEGRCTVFDQLKEEYHATMSHLKDVDVIRRDFSPDLELAVKDLIRKSFVATTNEITNSQVEDHTKQKLIDLFAEGLNNSFSMVFGNRKIRTLDYIYAKEDLLRKIKEPIPSNVAEFLNLTGNELAQKNEFESKYKYLKGIRERYNFIESFACILKLITTINDSKEVYNYLLSELASRKQKTKQNFLQNIFQPTNQGYISNQFIPEIDNIKTQFQKMYGSAGWKKLIGLGEKEFFEQLSKEKKHDFLTCLIGLHYAAGNKKSIAKLCSVVISELEREAIRVISACKLGSELPIIKEQHPTRDPSGVYGLPITILYRGYEFFEQMQLTDYNGQVTYSFDFDSTLKDPVATTLSQKDVSECIKKMIWQYKYYYFSVSPEAEENFNSFSQTVFQVLELNWLLGLYVPESINKLNRGKLSGASGSRMKVANTTTFELISECFSDYIGKPHEEVKLFLLPKIDIYHEMNEEYIDDVSKYSTPTKPDPQPVKIEIMEAIKRIK